MERILCPMCKVWFREDSFNVHVLDAVRKAYFDMVERIRVKYKLVEVTKGEYDLVAEPHEFNPDDEYYKDPHNPLWIMREFIKLNAKREPFT